MARRSLMCLRNLLTVHHRWASATAAEHIRTQGFLLERKSLLKEGSIRHVSAAHHTMEGCIRTLRELSNGASAYAHLSSTHGGKFPNTVWKATWYSSNTLLCTPASKTASSTSRIPPVIILKPAFVNSVGVKRTFSSSMSTNDTNTHTAQWHAKLAACKEDVTDWFAKKKAEDAAFLRYVSILVGSWCLIFWGSFSMVDRGPSQSDTKSCKGKNKSHCQAASSANPVVENPKV